MISKFRFQLFKPKVKLKYIHNNKNKSQSNGRRPFYYFDIDSYTRIITMIYYTKIKENNYKFELTYYNLKIKEKSI